MNNPRPVLSVAERLEHRAHFNKTIRNFFERRHVLEVDTPIFSTYANTDPFIQSLSADFSGQRMYAHTSPEFAMKRLLCEGSGDIYQMCKVFRMEELGRLHQQEFSMLEWYRLGMSYRDLAKEVVELLQLVGINSEPVEYTYQQLFHEYLGIDVLNTDADKLKQKALRHGLNDCGLGADINGWLNYLLTHLIEPELNELDIVVVYDFPATQAALAKLSSHDPRVALRFEIYSRGVELANGYQELIDSVVYRQRFEKENHHRRRNQLPVMPIDEGLLSSLDKGLPDCAGVALGLDRLLMLSLDQNSLSGVLAFFDEV